MHVNCAPTKEMGSPAYDLGSLCSSPLLYPEGDDFLRQPVNVFYDEDVSFDFVDSFGTGFAISRNGMNEKNTTLRTHDQALTSGRATSIHSDQADVECNNDKKTFKGESSSTMPFNNENRGSVDDTTSASEYTKSSNEVTSIKTGDLQSETLCINAEHETPENTSENEKKNHALSQNSCNDVKSGGQVNNRSSETNSSRDHHRHFSDSVYSNNNFDEKPLHVFHNDVLSPRGMHKPSGKLNPSQDLGRKESQVTRWKQIDGSSFSVKSSPFKRCVVPKTFYSPFWTPESSATKQKKLMEDGFIHAQRNVDILYCCNCRSQKRDAKSKRCKAKSDAGFYKDANKYNDFLKRDSVFKQQGNSSRHHNKTFTEVVSVHLDDSGTNNNDQGISLPAINTPPSKRKAVPNKKSIGGSFQSNALSLTSIERLIKKYKGHGFDLVEEQKRYQLKPFK